MDENLESCREAETRPSSVAFEGEKVENGEKRQKSQLSLDQELSWLPPSVSGVEDLFQFDSTTYHSAIPEQVKVNPDEPVVLGVDEAGRGPVLGPMVYVIAYSLETYLEQLQTKFGFADSKTLKDDKRQELFKLIEDANHELNRNVGWATSSLSAKDISSGMLRSALGANGSGSGPYNLNEQAHDTTIDLIKQVVAKGVNVKKVFVDTVGSPASYEAKLQTLFPQLQVTVTKKADSIYPIVSTASVVAKVTRDLTLNYINNHLHLLQNSAIGSGYPSDPNTSQWLNSNVDPVFGWCFGLVRFLWQTAKDSLEKNGAVPVIYEAECTKPDSGYYSDVLTFFVPNTALDNDYNASITPQFYGSSSVQL